jgi:hypothetical protein
MPAGLPYFAWIAQSETTFTSAHMRWDEQIFSFKLSQQEGDPASLTAVVLRPSGGLLAPGRLIWCWFAFDCGPDLIRFRGRLVGIPTSIFEELVTLEFVARPIDIVTQKENLAATLRVLPFYDEAVIDPARRTDPDVVLEGYTAVWHYDRETHIITVSDEINGEDGLVSFDGASIDGKVFYDGLGLSLTSGPLARVDVNAEYTWTQQAQGTVDLTAALIGPWPGTLKKQGIITSYSLTAANWPKEGTSIGEGWTVEKAIAIDLFDYTVKTVTENDSLIIQSPDGSSTRSSVNTSVSYVGSFAPINIASGTILKDEWRVTYGTDEEGLLYPSSFTRNISGTRGLYASYDVKVALIAAYKAERQCTERVSLSLFADVQPILTDPADGEALLVNDIRSINLSTPSNDTAGTPPIIDPSRRSYIATSRGTQSLEYLIAVARAHLVKRARVVEITFAPKLSRMPEVTLRKNASLSEPRVGNATGKIIAYSIALDGADGQVKCEIHMGCPIGRGGVQTATAGSPTYCDVSYVGVDYQQFINRTVLVSAFGDSSVGYEVINADPNDDGFNFPLSAGGVFEQNPAVIFGPDPTQSVPPGHTAITASTQSTVEEKLAARQEFATQVLAKYEARETFKLKSLTGSFETDYAVTVTDLKIPTGYNLEA